ncbi:PAS domain S-box-containing protein [Algoriphagus aquaeductus]|uniref:histidine kinase n=1 Tax=Algoriphagus aquaeductus TaxID=475299 RepID=A0A326S0N9_9BACT|nr:PAS domain-containing protein [Algoriphagus aquaeductus]PZV87460.1 PAS domain S-box-containing protein [Algoriphagus aquaeductus]
MIQYLERVKTATLNFLSTHPRITGWSVFLGIFFLTSYLSYTEYQIRLSNEREAVKAKLYELENSVLFSIRNGISAAKTLAFFAQNFDVTQNFDSIGRQILESNPNVDVIQYLDSGTIVSVYPLKGNESVIGYKVAEDPTRKEEVLEAFLRRDIYFSGPFTLRQGGVGIVGRYPIFEKSGELKGFSAVIIYLQTLIKNTGLAGQDNGLMAIRFSKQDKATGQWINFLPEEPGDKPYTGFSDFVMIPEGNWQLTVQLKESRALSGLVPSLLLRYLTAVIFGLITWNFSRIPNLLKKKVEEQSRDLKLINERFELASKATSDFIWDWDMEKNKTFRSPSFYENFGYGTHDSQDNNDFWESIIHPEDLAEVRANLNQALSGMDSYWEKEFRVRKKNGTYNFIQDKGFIIRNSNGKAIRMIGASQDVTARKMSELEIIQTNAKLSSANQELKAFAALASHDMREPLRMISSFMDLLQKRYGDKLDEKALQYIHFATDGAKRLTQMINDLLEYSKAGFDLEKLEEIEVGEIIQEVLELKSDIVRNTGAQLTFQGLPKIKALRIPLKILFQNLIGNSLKYVHPNLPPEIKVYGEEFGEFWKFTVQDNGIGIEADYLEEIFGILKRLHPKEKYPGTGMGLATCRKIVTQFGGEIWAESELGIGTQLIFTIKKL